MHHREDVVAHALRVLDEFGLADLTMRRLGAELGVRPSALYHHFPDKQTLLAAVADEILARGRTAEAGGAGAWDERVVVLCGELRDALLAYTDGAEVVATALAFGLGASAPYDDLVEVLGEAGLSAARVPTAVRALLHLTLGHTSEEQAHLQAASAGAIAGGPREGSDFSEALAIVVDGIRARVPAG